MRHLTPLRFFKELKEEFKKIEWTSSSELISYTQVIVSFMVVVSLGIHVADMVVKAFLVALRVLFFYGIS